MREEGREGEKVSEGKRGGKERHNNLKYSRIQK